MKTSLLVITLLASLCGLPSSVQAALGESKRSISRHYPEFDGTDYVVGFREDVEGRYYTVAFNERGESIAEYKSADHKAPFTDEEMRKFIFANTGVSRVTEIGPKHKLSFSDGFQVYNFHFGLRLGEKAYTNGSHLFLIIGPTRMIAFEGAEGARAYRNIR